MFLTLDDAAAALGVSPSALRRRAAAGGIPGALQIGGPRTPWRVPVAYVTGKTDGPPGEGRITPSGPGPQRRTLGPDAHDYVTPAPTADRVRHAATAAAVLARLHTSRPGTAASGLILDVTAAASRHNPDRDHRCGHCGWTWPCPDRTDLDAALARALDALGIDQ